MRNHRDLPAYIPAEAPGNRLESSRGIDAEPRFYTDTAEVISQHSCDWTSAVSVSVCRLYLLRPDSRDRSRTPCLL